MAAGDLLTTDGQVELGGHGAPLLLGGSNYQIIDLDLFSTPDITDEREQLSRDGVAAGRMLLGSVMVKAQVQIRGTAAQIVSRRADLAAACALGTDEDYLAFMLGGTKFLYFGRPQKTQTAQRVGYPTDVRFLALESAYYSCTVTSTAVDDSTTVTNAGTRSTGWEVVVTPPSVPLVGFYVRRLDDTANTIKYDGTVGVGQTLRINTRTREAVKDGVDVSAHLSDGAGGPPAWWRLLPGNNSVGTGATSGASDQTITHRAGYEV